MTSYVGKSYEDMRVCYSSLLLLPMRLHTVLIIAMFTVSLTLSITEDFIYI